MVATPDQPDFANDYLMPAGSTLRFAVGEKNGLRSTVWTIATNKTRSDLYLASMSLRQTMKTSFHESGQWQHSINSDKAMDYVERNRDRHLEVWDRPAAIGGGWTRAYYLTFPRTELRPPRPGDNVDNVRFAPLPAVGHWTTIDIWIHDSSVDSQLRFAGAGIFILGRVALANGHVVSAVARHHQAEPNGAEHIRLARESVIKSFAMGDEKLTSFVSQVTSDPMLCLFLPQEDNTRGIIEICLSEQPEEVRVICASNAEWARGTIREWLGGSSTQTARALEMTESSEH